MLLNLRYVPGPSTLFHGVEKLMPGHLLIHEGGGPRVVRYWQWPEEPELSRQEAVEGFLPTLEAAVRRQRVADVPVGLFLSGGLDSGALVAAARRERSGDVKTFTLGFGEPTDELEDARRVASHFATDHHEETVSPDPLGSYACVVHHSEEAKVNAIQGYFLSAFARKKVKVALTGMGGDELFMGYELFSQLETVRKVSLSLGPASLLARPLARGLRHLGGTFLGLPFENARRGLELVAALNDPALWYLTLRNAWDTEPDLLGRIYLPEALRKIRARSRDFAAPWFTGAANVVRDAMAFEQNYKMVDDFLANEDRMSMAHSLELRVPFLDREMISFARRIPVEVLGEGGALKSVMKQALRHVLPMATLRKPKWGFTFNPYHVFRKGLKERVQEMLDSGRIERLGLVRPSYVQEVLDATPRPALRWHFFFIWTLLGLCHWQEIFEDGGGRAPGEKDPSAGARPR